MDMNPLVLDLLRDGELPEDISEEDATETWRIARAQRDICLCRLSIAQLNHALPESEKGWSTGSSGLS